jgi:threonine dehydratase
MAPSVLSGTPQKRPAGSPTIMDGLSGPVAGTRTSRVLRECGASGLSVSDAQVLEAMAIGFRFLKLVLEPAGAAPLAAVLNHRAHFEGRSVAVICSGGNVDPSVFIRALHAS